MHELQIRYKSEVKALVAASRSLCEKGFVTSRGGNLSYRVDKDVVLITPTGVSKGEVTFDDVIFMASDGRILYQASGITPTSETPSHLAILAGRPDVNAVIHAHPPVLTGFALAGNEILSRPIHPEFVIELGPIITLDYAEPTSGELATQLERVLLRANAFLLKNHGIMICSAGGVERALELLVMAESFAYSTWIALVAGKIEDIPPEQVDKLETIMRSRGLTMPGLPGSVKRLRDLYY